MKKSLTIDIEKIKSMAKKLKKELESSGVKFSFMQCCELTAKQVGFKNYNTALALIPKEKLGVKELSYTFEIRNKSLKYTLILEIENSLQKLYQSNNNFKHDLFVFDSIITLNLYFEPNKMANEGMIIDVMLISLFKEQIVRNNLIVDKRDLLIRDEKTSINESLISALNQQ